MGMQLLMPLQILQYLDCSFMPPIEWLEKLMNQLKVVFPFLAALGVYFLALNSPMYQQMNQPHSVENEIESISVESFK